MIRPIESRKLMNTDIDIECTVTATSDQMASGIFRLASHRLLDANTWNELDGSLLSPCKLTDEHGATVNRALHQNDYLQIQTTSDATVNDGKWIRFEKVEEESGQAGMESLILQARPASNPLVIQIPEAADGSGSSIISVVRRGLNITARVHANANGNFENSDVVDRMRNVSMAVYSTLGAYCVQWRSLVHAILGDLNDAEKYTTQL